MINNLTKILDEAEFKLVKKTYPYYTFKKSINPSKGVILFIHGYGFDSSYHNFFASLVNDYDYYAIELPGHGFTKQKDIRQLSPWEYAEMVISLIKKLKLSRINLIGHSMGGGIAMIVASRISLLIRRLILVCPMNSFGTTNIKDFLFNFNPKSTKEANKFYKIVLYDKKWLDDERAGTVISRMLELNNNQEKEFKILKKNMASIKNIVTLSKAESSIINKTLLIVGSNDNCINPKTTKHNLSKKIRNLKIVQFNKCGHIPMFEKLDEYYHEVINFIENDI